MYYSVTQVCRCNEETRTNSSETSLTGQPLYDTSTNELYIGDGETTIQNLSPIQNLKAGSGMTYTNGSVSLNEGTQTNAGGIKVWAENNDIYYSTPNGVGTQLFPIIRTYHPGYNQAHPNYHTLSGTASNQYDTGGRQPHHLNIDIALERAQYDTGDRIQHHDDISMTLNYKESIEGSDTITDYATGTIYCNNPEYIGANASTRLSDSISNYGTITNNAIIIFNDINVTSDYTYERATVTIYGNDGFFNKSTEFLGFTNVQGHLAANIKYTIENTTGITYALTFDITVYIKKESGNYTGAHTYTIPHKNVTGIGEPTGTSPAGRFDIISLKSEWFKSTNSIYTSAKTNAIAEFNYKVPYTYIPDTYLYEGTTTKDIGDDAESVSVYPATPGDTTAHVEYSGSTATITANCIFLTNVGSSITRVVTLSYSTPIYGYKYEGTTTKDIGDDAENVQVSPSSPSGMTANVSYSGSTATISASYISSEDIGDSISGSATLSYNTPVYGYYTNVSTYIGSDYGAKVTSTSSSVTSYSSGTSGSYFWVNMRAASQTSVSANAVSYWDSYVSGYNSYHYPIELNGVRYNFNIIDLDGVNYTATAEKYNKR